MIFRKIPDWGKASNPGLNPRWPPLQGARTRYTFIRFDVKFLTQKKCVLPYFKGADVNINNILKFC